MRSSILAGLNLVVMLWGCSLLGYAFAQAHWRRRGTFSILLLIVLCGQLWLIPQAVNFFGFHSTRLLYSLWFGNWIVSAVGVLLFGLTFRGTSRHLLDAARLDGSGFFSVYRYVVWPVLKPALAALAVILLMATWAEFTRPLLPGTDDLPLTPGVARVPVSGTSKEIAMLIAASFLATLPVIAIFFFARRQFAPEATLPVRKG